MSTPWAHTNHLADLSITLELNNLRQLKHIQFCLGDEGHFRHALRSLSTLPKVNCLVDVALVAYPFTSRCFELWDSWRELDRVLIQERYFTHLRKVVIDVCNYLPTPEFRAELAHVYKIVMPLLFSKGQLYLRHSKATMPSLYEITEAVVSFSSCYHCCSPLLIAIFVFYRT